MPPEYTHDMEVTLDASNCFQLYTACNQFTVNARQVIIKIIQNKTQWQKSNKSKVQWRLSCCIFCLLSSHRSVSVSTFSHLFTSLHVCRSLQPPQLHSSSIQHCWLGLLRGAVSSCHARTTRADAGRLKLHEWKDNKPTMERRTNDFSWLTQMNAFSRSIIYHRSNVMSRTAKRDF